MARRKTARKGRRKGSKNKSPRELRAEAKRLIQIAKLQERIDKLRAQ
jgi:hypothetical protein